LKHYNANQGTFGLNSVVSAQYGYYVDPSLTGGVANYGFYSGIAAGTNRYNLYMNGTADNYLAGSLGIGSLTTGASLSVNKLITGGLTSYGAVVAATINSDVASNANMFFSLPSTIASTFTLGSLRHFYASQNTIGAGSAVTNQYGYHAELTLTGATNNYGFFGNIAASVGTTRYNLYMNGTAPNYLAGDLQLAKTVTAAGTTGAQTINKTTGTVNFAAGAASLVVTNSLVTANSIIIATVGSNDTTMKSVAVVAGAGSFTLYANAAATAETRVNFLITN
jgi:hypothetical protein